MDKFIATLLSLAALLALLLVPVMLLDDPGEAEARPHMDDCMERVSVPVIGIMSFAFCPADSTVWTGEEWSEPTPFEWRRIEKLEARHEK